MDLWEYKTIAVQVEGGQQYVMTLDNGSKVYGLDPILNYWSQAGWELVTLLPVNYEGKINRSMLFNDVLFYAARLFLILKRRQAPIDPYNLPPQE